MQGPRHGQQWDRQGVSPPRGAVVQPIPTSPTSDTKHGIIPVRSIDAFFAELPPQVVQFMTYSGQVRISSSNLVAGKSIQISTMEVPATYAFVLTDIQWYGQAPSRHLETPPITIAPDQFAGLLRFDLVLGDKPPIRSLMERVNPYSALSTPAIPAAGWPFAMSPATTRGTFVIYVKSRQVIVSRAWVDVVPRFWLTLLGVRIFGYTLPELDLEKVLKKVTK